MVDRYSWSAEWVIINLNYEKISKKNVWHIVKNLKIAKNLGYNLIVNLDRIRGVKLKKISNIENL